MEEDVEFINSLDWEIFQDTDFWNNETWDSLIEFIK